MVIIPVDYLVISNNFHSDHVTKQRAVNHLKEVMKQFEEIDISAVAIVIMAHGGEFDEIKFSDNKTIPLRTLLLPMLECENLNGKPKIVVTQFCRGNNFVRAVDDEFVQVDGDLPIRVNEQVRFKTQPLHSSMSHILWHP